VDCRKGYSDTWYEQVQDKHFSHTPCFEFATVGLITSRRNLGNAVALRNSGPAVAVVKKNDPEGSQRRRAAIPSGSNWSLRLPVPVMSLALNHRLLAEILSGFGTGMHWLMVRAIEAAAA